MDKKKAGNSERTAGGRQVDKAYRAGVKNNKDIAAKSACGTPQALILYAERQEI